MNLQLAWDIFVSFTRATLLGYGGGPAIIPLYQIEVVDQRHWMSPQEFGDALAIGNALPGPIATKLSAFIGFKVGGWAGATAALLGVVLPTALIMIALVGVLVRFKDSPLLRGAIRGVRPVVFVMLAMLAVEFFPHAFAPGPRVLALLSVALAAGYFLMVHYLHVHPFWGVLGALVIGAIFYR